MSGLVRRVARAVRREVIRDRHTGRRRAAPTYAAELQRRFALKRRATVTRSAKRREKDRARRGGG